MKNLSVLDNIIFPAVKSKKNRSSRRQTEERGRALMHRLGIGDVCGNDINEVSGGQLQRACICRSMINNPKMIFADEPTGNVELVQHYSKKMLFTWLLLSILISFITDRQRVRFSSRVNVL